MKAKSYAKINLCLDVLKKGQKFHFIHTVFRQIELHDTLTITETDGAKISVECDDSALPKSASLCPSGPSNSAYKAASLMRKIARASGKSPAGLLIKIQKRIPVASGLGGASSNAAAVINALNKMWRLKLPVARLRALAAEIGMDTPFFITGGTALGTHYGEKITPLPPIKLPPFLIAINGRKNSTKEMYRMLDLKKTGKKKGLTDSLIRGAGAASSPRASSVETVGLFHNDFGTVLAHKQMASTRQLFGILLRSGASGVHICGSGPAICSFYKNQRELTRAYDNLPGKVKFLWKGPKN